MNSYYTNCYSYLWSIYLVLGSTVTPPTPSGDYSGNYEIGLEQVASMTRDNNNAALQQYGGASQL